MGAGYSLRNGCSYIDYSIIKVKGIWEKRRADSANGKTDIDGGKAKGKKSYNQG